MRVRRWRGLMLGPNIQWVLGGNLNVGRGVLLGGMSYIDCSASKGVHLGDGVTIREFAWIQGRSGINSPAEGLWIGERTYIGPRSVIGLGGKVIIGANVQVGAGLTITAEAHVAGSDGSFVSGETKRKGVIIGDRCWLGNNVSILDGVEIGSDCVVGANSLVTRSLPSGTTSFGAPAKVRKAAASQA